MGKLSVVMYLVMVEFYQVNDFVWTFGVLYACYPEHHKSHIQLLYPYVICMIYKRKMTSLYPYIRITELNIHRIISFMFKQYIRIENAQRMMEIQRSSCYIHIYMLYRKLLLQHYNSSENYWRQMYIFFDNLSMCCVRFCFKTSQLFPIYN